MNKKIFGVCDLDKGYAHTLAHFINVKLGDRFDVMAFSRREALEEFLRKNTFDIALISDGFIGDSDGEEIELNRFPQETTFILSEERDEMEYDFQSIYKYQSSEKILSEIMSAYDKRRPQRKRRTARTKVLGVFSPIKRCGKTTLALALSSVVASKMPTLFISMEDISGLDFLRKDEGYIGLSDLLYKYTVDEKDDVFDTLLLKKRDGYDYISSVSCPEDIRNADCTMLAYIVSQLQESGDYQCVVIDVGDELCEPEKVLEVCDVVYVPSVNDDISSKKMEAWQEAMRQKGFNGMINEFAFANVPNDDVEAYARVLIARTLGSKAKE